MKFKKTICIISSFILIASAFCACNKNADEEQTTTQPTVTIGQEAYTSHNNQYAGAGVNIVSHMSSNEFIIQNDYLDENGKIKYVEKFVYNEYGETESLSYYDPNGKFVAKHNVLESKFCDENDNQIDENEFISRMRTIGAAQ